MSKIIEAIASITSQNVVDGWWITAIVLIIAITIVLLALIYYCCRKKKSSGEIPGVIRYSASDLSLKTHSQMALFFLRHFESNKNIFCESQTIIIHKAWKLNLYLYLSFSIKKIISSSLTSCLQPFLSPDNFSI